MIVRLDFPDPKLFPNRKNGRSHYATQGPKVKAREDAYVLTKQAMAGFQPADGPIPLSIVFVPPTCHRRDLDNMLAACKPALDGMAMALGVDDSRFRPILIDVGQVSKPGAVIVGVGVSIVTTGVL